MMLCGCTAHQRPPRKSIEDLYLDAQRASARSVQPAAIDPAVPVANGIGQNAQLALPLSTQGDRERSASDGPANLDAIDSGKRAQATTPAKNKTQLSDLQPPTAILSGDQILSSASRRLAMPVPIGSKAVPIQAKTRTTTHNNQAERTKPTKQLSTPPEAIGLMGYHLSDQADSGQLPPTKSTSTIEQPTVNEVFEETDIREAIRVLANLAGQSVIIDDTVGGFTSATIENESFENALRKITLPLGLVVGKYRGQYLVGTTDPSSNLFPFLSVTFRYEPQHRSSKSLIELLPERLRPYIQIGENWNIIVVDGPETIGQEIVNRLRDLDQPVPQVLLEAIICVVSPDSGFRFGIDWTHSLSRDTSKALEVGVKNLSFSGLANQAGIKDAFQDFAVTSAFVQALADQGYITIRATPRVFAKDGEKAEIIIGRETFFSLQPTNTSSLLFRPDVQKVIAGITLTIIPHIRGENVSVLIEKAEVSEDIRTSTAQLSANPYPIINRRTVTTTVHVRDGHTIAIGGLVQRQTVERTSKIPVLGDVPLVGKLFQTMESQEQDVEIAIFISPRIVKPCADSSTDCNIMISPQPHENSP